jgi:hypothetical protein
MNVIAISSSIEMPSYGVPRLFQFSPWKLSAGRNLQASKISRKD